MSRETGRGDAPAAPDSASRGIASAAVADALSCPACGAPLPSAPAIRGADRLHGIPGDFAVHVCTACGSGRTTPVVPTERLGELYPQAYNAYALPANPLARAAATGLFRWRYWRGLRRPPLAELSRRAPGRLLDVGSGRGDLGVTLSDWDVTGLEPSPEACAEARARGVPTIEGTLTTAQVEGPFDALVFQHSLEHVAEPLDDLHAARELLAPSGLVLISLPNFGSWHARRFRSDWFHLDLPRHRSHFTARGITELLTRAGFTVHGTHTSTSADGVPMSLQYRRFGERRYKEGAALYAATAVTLASAPITALLDRDGDLLHAVASR
jgi:SAM-dependent methyltransferase